MSFTHKKTLSKLIGTSMSFQIITQQGMIKVKAGKVLLGLLV